MESAGQSPRQPRAHTRAGATLAAALDPMTAEAAPELVERLPNGHLACHACARHCRIPAGKRGQCQVRYHDAETGSLRVPHGYVAVLQVDPIEKKPFHHVLPGQNSLTYGMMGCDLHCGYCQNWLTSQALRDESSGVRPHIVTADELAQMAVDHGAPMVAASYNEPLITAEWAHEIFTAARSRGLKTGIVSNGSVSPQVLDFLAPVLDAVKIDLKTFRDPNYRTLGGTLDAVTDAIRLVHDRGLWLEVVTLVIPGFNDTDAELREMAEFLAGVSPDIPWHLTAFHRDYKFRDRSETQTSDIVRAADIGRAAGLRYVYAGNNPGRVGHREHTLCPTCAAELVTRAGIQVTGNILDAGHCPNCRTPIPGLWS